MSKGDISIVGGQGVTLVHTFRTDDRTTSAYTATIKPGEPVEAAGAGGNFLRLLDSGSPINTTGSARFIGVAQDESTETSAADGTCGVFVVVPYLTVMRARATTVGNMDADTELLGIMFDAVTFTNSAGSGVGAFTINEDEGDDPNVHGLVIVGGDINKNTLDVIVKPLCTLFGNNI